MPKEIISPVPGRAFIMKWGREQRHGQVGIELSGNWFSFHKDLHKDAIPEYDSLWFDFETREDYNKAIRTLRKMRDTQFGRDA